MRLSKHFISFVVISIFYEALLISKRFFCCEIMSAVTDSKEIVFLMVEILGWDDFYIFV